jgi:lipoyl synthase
MVRLDTQEPLKQAGARLPPWIRIRYSGGGTQGAVNDLLKAQSLHTVCQGAHCPNQHECFSRGVATFMILGDVCTRDCRFCAVKTGQPGAVDVDEPRRLAEVAARLKLRHVVVTSVTRDDLADGGAGHFAATILRLRELIAAVTVEVLTPDFKGVHRDLDTVLEARPDVFNHNLETVRRLQKAIRPAADYDRSLAVLGYVAGVESRESRVASCESGIGVNIAVKSGLMVGLGETDEEILETMADLRSVGVELLTIGQYLAPSGEHASVQRYVPPAQFDEYARRGMAMGFRHVASGPMVRSSYMAEEHFRGKAGERS